MESDRSANRPDSLGDDEPQTDEDLRDADDAAQRTEAELLTDAALQPDDPVEGEAARRGADPDLAPDSRGEEP